MLAQRLPLITAIALCLLISGLIYWQIQPMLLPFLKGQELNQIALSAESGQSHQAQLIQVQNTEKNYNIANFKLFGDASKPVQKEVVVTENLPETTLRLTLTGVLAGKDNIQASALIEGPDKQTRNYRVSEEVPGGAILREVYADRVVLERSGRLENLIFEEKRSIGILQQAAVVPEPSVYAPLNIHQQTPPDLDSFNQQQTQQIKDRLSRLRNRLQSSGQ